VFVAGRLCVRKKGDSYVLTYNDYEDEQGNARKGVKKTLEVRELGEKLQNPVDMGISWDLHKWGYPNSWMIYHGKDSTKMDDLEVPRNGNPHIISHIPLYSKCSLIVEDS